MPANLVVVRFPGSKETTYWLEERYTEAIHGRLIGVAAIAMYSHSHYAISIRGEIRRAPTFARGLLGELDYQLAQIIRRDP
jgi:hypothetical protein